MVILDVGHICDIGDKRKQNEDRVLVKTANLSQDECGLFAVADGMGGLECGSEASRLLDINLCAWWDNFTQATTIQSLDLAIQKTHEEVVAFTKKTGQTSGSTLSLMLLMGRRIVIRHIGDSRIYKLNRNNGIQQLTPDHTYAKHQIEAGAMTVAEAMAHPKRNALTKCIGMNRQLELYHHEEIYTSGDIFLICSDGFYNTVPDNNVFDSLFTPPFEDMQTKAETLRSMIGKGRAYDNVSIVLVYPDDTVDTETILNE